MVLALVPAVFVLAVIEGRKRYDGEFEIRVGPRQGTETEGAPIGHRAE